MQLSIGLHVGVEGVVHLYHSLDCDCYSYHCQSVVVEDVCRHIWEDWHVEQYLFSVATIVTRNKSLCCVVAVTLLP